jgi:hypothetical protein
MNRIPTYPYLPCIFLINSVKESALDGGDGGGLLGASGGFGGNGVEDVLSFRGGPDWPPRLSAVRPGRNAYEYSTAASIMPGGDQPAPEILLSTTRGFSKCFKMQSLCISTCQWVLLFDVMINRPTHCFEAPRISFRGLFVKLRRFVMWP